MLPARAQGVPIVSIATILPVNDSALMSLGSDGITTAADLGGKTYGGYGGPLETELINRLAECGGVDPASVKHVEVGNVDYLAGLEANRFDVVWMFAGWDALRASEIEHADIDLIRFDDYDRLHPELVHAAVHHERDDDRGRSRPRARVPRRRRLVATSSRSTTRQRATEAHARGRTRDGRTVVAAAADYYATRFATDDEPFGTQDEATWTDFEAFLVDAGLLESEVPVGETFTNDYLP